MRFALRGIGTSAVVLSLTTCLPHPRPGENPIAVPAMTAACDVEESSCGGAVLFGRPTSTTGLTSEQCKPSCSCGGTEWEPPEYTSSDIDTLLTWQLVDPPEDLLLNPYDALLPAPNPADVCAVMHDASGERAYRLETFESMEAATAAGGQVTHFGGCGVCSTLADLAVYLRESDLATPVRQCGLDHPVGPMEAHLQCLTAIGFTRPCAQMWYYNTIHTRTVCLDPCLATLDDPYHLPSGELNECLACDERLSGTVFKSVAGRTRRNTGIASALCRPCSEVQAIEHYYR